MDTPVALLIFNRPEHTARVFREIARAKPPTLLVVADGPRPHQPEEAALCQAARDVLTGVDWDCQVLTAYSESNLGCRQRVASGLSWVFDQVEEAIVLEDDCLPHPSFFPYCEALLDRYRDDSRVMTVSGTNYVGQWQADAHSYHFSRFVGIWGWATWRRAWNLYDVDMGIWPRARDDRLLDGLFPDRRHRRYWEDIYQRVYEGQIDTWDYQWILTCWAQHSLQVLPAMNLVSNIGFGPGATHTLNINPLAEIPTADLDFPLRHPSAMLRSVELDRRIQDLMNPRYDRRSRIVARIARHSSDIRESPLAIRPSTRESQSGPALGPH